MHRSRLVSTIRVLFVCGCLVLPAQAQWPQFGGPNRDFSAPPSLEQNSGLGVWSLTLGVGDAAPVMDNNQIIVTEVAYSDDGQAVLQVRCVEPQLGATRWQSQVLDRSYTSQDISERYPVRPLASPLVTAGKIITVSYGGCVACLEQQTGRVVWQHDLVQEFKATPLQYGWATSPWSDGKNVVVACGGPQCLVIAFDLQTGETVWQSEPGEAAYGSFTEILLTGKSAQLCYLGRDDLVGLDPRDGKRLWTFPLPKPQLTNAVTPLALADGSLVVAGQGMESSRRLRIEPAGRDWKVTEVWKAKSSPFYCNWLVEPSTMQIVGNHSNLLVGIDVASGKTNWKKRGWTDANFARQGASIIGVRGDGLITVSKITADGLDVKAGARAINDRVWAPPVVVGHWALVRGRTSLTCVDLNTLPKLDSLPSGTQVDSMRAMYGEKHEKIVALQQKLSSAPAEFGYDDYHAVVDDRAIQFGESDYRSMMNALRAGRNQPLQLRIAEDWVKRQPDSIAAVETWIELLRQEGDLPKMQELIDSRFVKITFDVTPPVGMKSDGKVYLAGNAAAVGSWKPDGLWLKRGQDGHFRGQVAIPRGDFEFKLTQGDWDSAEVGSDGRKLSNRRRRIAQPATIEVTVAAWKSDLK